MNLTAKILIADDDTNIRLLLNEIITRDGHEVIHMCINGSEALQHFYHYIPDITILDYHMPYINGIDVAKRILKSHPHAKIIMCTGNFEKQYDVAQLLGITLIAKPFTSTEITQSIKYNLTNIAFHNTR